MKLQEEQIRQILELISRVEDKELRIEVGDIVITVKEGDGVRAFRLTPIDEIVKEVLPKKEIPKKPKKEVLKGEDIITVKAPSSGVFYRRPDPDAPPYVEIGSIVEPGDTLGLIEVMKSFGPIVSEVKGEVVDILVEDGKPVEYGQELFLIKRIE